MRILVAPNAFKNSLPATEAAEAIARGLLQSNPNNEIQVFPIGDGGDGTAELIMEHIKGTFINVSAHDATGRKIESFFGLTQDRKTAVIELADTSGLKRIKTDERNPLHANTYGTGEVFKKGLDLEVGKIILCVGGSATIDGGCGILKALGLRFLDGSGIEMNPIPYNLIRLDSINLSGLDKRLASTELIILCDVENNLLGEKGAAAVFGPQKGASKEDLHILEYAMQKFRDVCFNQFSIDINLIQRGGAAGGVAAGLHFFLNGNLVSGIEYFLNLTGFDQALENTELLITGEGSIDEQTLEGKGPFGVARRAKNKKIPVIGVAGKIPNEKNTQLEQYFDRLIAIGDPLEDLKTALARTEEYLQRTAFDIGNQLPLMKF